MHEQKKKSLREEMIRFLDTVLDQSEEEKSLDHFKIEISNHGGTLQLDLWSSDEKSILKSYLAQEDT